MPLPASFIESHPDRDMIDADIRAGGPHNTVRKIATRWNVSAPTIQRRKRALEKVATKQAPNPVQPVAAEGAQQPRPPVAPPVTPEIEIAALTPVDSIDADEAGHTDTHLHRLRMINVFRARGRKLTEIAQALGRPLPTVERWAAQARKDKRAALAKLDIGQEIHDAIWFATFARSQHLLNAEQCLARGDMNGHRRAMEAAVRDDVARTAYVTKLTELGIVQPAAKLSEPSDQARVLIGNVVKRLLAPLIEEHAPRPAPAAEPAPEPEPTPDPIPEDK
jgi:transposase